MTSPENATSKPELSHQGPNYTADPIILSKDGKLLLILRKNGKWALPGGFVDDGENPEDASRREAYEETGLAVTEPGTLIYSGKVEDSRNSEDRWIETSAYVIEVADASELTPDLSEVDDAQWFAACDIPFDLHGSHEMLLNIAFTGTPERPGSSASEILELKD